MFLQMTFDDSYTLYVSRIDVFQVVLCYFSPMELFFLREIFLGIVH